MLPSIARRALRLIVTAVMPVAAPLAFLAAPASGQSGLLQSASASVQLRVTVPAVLKVQGTAVVRRDSTEGYITVTERVLVSGNIGHRLVARSSVTGVAVRLRGGVWEPVGPGTGVAVAESHLRGETTHLVMCRRPASMKVGSTGCGLDFDLVPAESGYVVAHRAR